MTGFLHLNFLSLLVTIIYSVLIYSYVNDFVESSVSDCFNIKDYYWKYLGSKTPYRFVANHNSSVISYDGCVPKRIWAIIRHGTRYPNEKFINKMNTRLVEIRNAIFDQHSQKSGALCSLHMDNITLWTPQIELSDQKRLAHEGEDEMVELAERFKSRFPSLLDVDYNNSSFNFRCTATERTKKSQYHFTVGLFGRRVAHHVWSAEPIYKDPVLRFYKLCPKWIKQVDKNPKSKVEVDRFKASDVAQKVLKNVVLRLGYEGLSFEDVELMYVTCTYESSWNRVTFSPWCSVFSEEDMQVMEFSRDLKYYWTSGYGYDINFQQACPVLEDFLQKVQSKNNPTSTFYFTHSGVVLKLLAHLGLYYDDFKLTHDKFQKPRLWKVSYMDAFGSNLAFITFQCGEETKVLTLHQERPVKLPGCPKEGLCGFEKILKVYKNSFTNYFKRHLLKKKNWRPFLLKMIYGTSGEVSKLSKIQTQCRTKVEIMAEDCDKINLIKIKPEISLFGLAQEVSSKNVATENILNNKSEKAFSKSLQDTENRILATGRITRDDEAVEERQRTGRYLAIGVTLVMLFIAIYHTLLRHATVLAGLLAPAIIMLLYILWLFYFAKKKKTQVSAV